MAKSINKFIVKLSDLSNFKPKLTVKVSVVKDKPHTYKIQLVHPNYTLDEAKKKVYKMVHEEEFVSEKPVMQAISDAVKKGYEIRERPEIQMVEMQTEYIDQIFIPQGRRGKVKLKTKATADAEAAALKAAMDPDAEIEMDEVLEDLPEDMDLSQDEDSILADDEELETIPRSLDTLEDDEESEEEELPKKKVKAKNKEVKKAPAKNKKVKKETKKTPKAKKKVVVKNKKKKK